MLKTTHNLTKATTRSLFNTKLSDLIDQYIRNDLLSHLVFRNDDVYADFYQSKLSSSILSYFIQRYLKLTRPTISIDYSKSQKWFLFCVESNCKNSDDLVIEVHYGDNFYRMVLVQGRLKSDWRQTILSGDIIEQSFTNYRLRQFDVKDSVLRQVSFQYAIARNRKHPTVTISLPDNHRGVALGGLLLDLIASRYSLANRDFKIELTKVKVDNPLITRYLTNAPYHESIIIDLFCHPDHKDRLDQVRMHVHKDKSRPAVEVVSLALNEEQHVVSVDKTSHKQDNLWYLKIKLTQLGKRIIQRGDFLPEESSLID